MATTYSFTDSVLALGRLFEFCSNRRFHLINNEFINDSIGQKALEINNEIKIQTGIDLFELTSEDALLEYEKILSTYTTQYTNREFGELNIKDEVELFKSQVQVSTDKISQYDIRISDGLKPYLKKYSLTVPNIISICKKCDHASYLENCASFFLTKRIDIKHKSRIVFVHLTFEEPDRSTKYIAEGRSRHLFARERTPIKNFSTSTLLVRMILIFNYDYFHHIFESPVKLFIKALDLYGVDVEINGSVKKLHVNVILPPHIRSIDTPFYKLHYKNKEHIRTVSAFKPSNIAFQVALLYSIYMEKALNDFLMGRS